MFRFLASIIILLASYTTIAQPIALHAENKHYLMYHGKPLILIGSTEHYGAVINLEFDYLKYLNALQVEGINLARLFVGTYFEKQSAFGIEKNTLAPSPGKIILPWARSNMTGYINGGNKFDLEKWDGKYFLRLKEFVNEAQSRNIIVEVVLFSSLYNEDVWAFNPFNLNNNVNQTDKINLKDLHTLKNGNIKIYQEKVVRKVVNELNQYDNIYFEIQNAPWADNGDSVGHISDYLLSDDFQNGSKWKNQVEVANKGSIEWQREIKNYIIDEESKLTGKHMIAQNFSNFKYSIPEISDGVSIINFHYAYPECVSWNYHFNLPISFDETGFAGSNDFTYRQQSWKFFMEGGSIFNHLDYSFTVGYEAGNAVYKAAGGGSKKLRQQFKILKDFLMSFDLPKLKPDKNVIIKAQGVVVQCLSTYGSQYAIYISGHVNHACELTLDVPPGSFKAEWIDTKVGNVQKTELFSQNSRIQKLLKSPAYSTDIALRITKK